LARVISIAYLRCLIVLEQHESRAAGRAHQAYLLGCRAGSPRDSRERCGRMRGRVKNGPVVKTLSLRRRGVRANRQVFITTREEARTSVLNVLRGKHVGDVPNKGKKAEAARGQE